MSILNYFGKLNKYNIFYLLKNFSKIYFNIFSSILKSRKIIIFDINEIGYVEHIKNYIEIANSLKSVDIYIVTREIYITNPKIVKFKKPTFPVKFLKFIFFVDLYISPGTDNFKPMGSYYIHVFHNQPIKYLSYPNEILRNIDEHFVWGPFMRNWLKEMIFIKSVKVKITNIGNPRIDKDHHNISSNKNSSKLRIGYAPSWDKGLSLRTAGLDIIKSLSFVKNSIIDIRLHPCSIVSKSHGEYAFYTGKVDWVKKIKESDLKNINFTQNNSTVNYLSKIDILVTDVSSISFEAYLLDIPVIFYHTKDFWVNYKKSVYKKYMLSGKEIFLEENEYLNGGREGGIVVNNVEELIYFINKIKDNKDPSQFKRREFSRKLLFNKGKSSLAIKKRLKELLN